MHHDMHDDSHGHGHGHGDTAAGETPAERSVLQVEVRRNALLSAFLVLGMALLAGMFAVRAYEDSALLDWALFTVLGVLALVHVGSLVDSRAPLLVADDHGVRLREGSTWQGLAWSDMDCLEHLPRHGLVKDGHLLVVGNDDRQLIVPLTLATRVVGADKAELSDTLADLAAGRTDVVEVVPGLAEDDAQVTDDHDATPPPPPPGGRVPHLGDVYDDDPQPPSPRHGIAEQVEADHALPRPFPTAQRPLPGPDQIATGEMDAVPAPSGPGRATRLPVLRAARSATESLGLVRGANALQPEVVVEREELPEAVLLRRTEVDLDPIEDEHVPEDTPLADPEHTVVLTDVSVRPADEPVIGPQLKEARERLRLSIAQLSERTRVRVHVIEAIEVDDFGPCGGDFYARGHLRTLARVLGVEAAPLIATYDDAYADAPVDPRRVFAPEIGGLARSARGSRGPRAGRNWSVIVAAVMAAILVWSVARLVMDGPVAVEKPPVLNQSGGLPKPAGKVDPVPVSLTAVAGGAELVVRDADGNVAFDGNLAFGQTTELRVVPPIRVWSSDGSVTVSLDGAEAEPLGDTGVEASTTLVAPAD